MFRRPRYINYTTNFLGVTKTILDLIISELNLIEKERNINGYHDMSNNKFLNKQPHLSKNHDNAHQHLSQYL